MQTGGLYRDTSNMGYVSITPLSHATFPVTTPSTLTRSATSPDLIKLLPTSAIVACGAANQEGTETAAPQAPDSNTHSDYPTTHHRRILLNVSQKKLHNRCSLNLVYCRNLRNRRKWGKSSEAYSFRSIISFMFMLWVRCLFFGIFRSTLGSLTSVELSYKVSWIGYWWITDCTLH